MGCISSQQLPPPNPVQVDLSHFLICRVLGRGGFGKVQAVQRRVDERYFAMKSLSKHRLLKREHSIHLVWLERQVMSSFHSPFLVTCVYAFQDPLHLYMVMPLMLGGDLRYFLRQRGACRESEARFYMAETLLALEHMHSLRIVYRDLKPDNILLDAEGHIRLSDFGLSGRIKSSDGKTSGYCGTQGYIAPEVRDFRRYDGSCDFYAFGVVLYELLCRYVPSRVREHRERLTMEEALMGGPAIPATDPAGKGRGDEGDAKQQAAGGVDPAHSDASLDLEQLFDPRLTRKPTGLSPACKDLLTGLLQEEPGVRLGSRSAARWEEVKAHEWFSSVDWAVAASRGMIPPFVPNVSVANCDPVWELEEQLMKSKVAGPPLTAEEQAVFAGWEFGVREGEVGGEREEGPVRVSMVGVEEEAKTMEEVGDEDVQVEMGMTGVRATAVVYEGEKGRVGYGGGQHMSPHEALEGLDHDPPLYLTQEG